MDESQHSDRVVRSLSLCQQGGNVDRLDQMTARGASGHDFAVAA
jgi:hypothetical protein